MSEFGERDASTQGVRILSNNVMPEGLVQTGVGSSKTASPASSGFGEILSNLTSKDSAGSDAAQTKRGGKDEVKDKDARSDARPQTDAIALNASVSLPSPVNQVQVALSAGGSDESQPNDAQTALSSGAGRTLSVTRASDYSGEPMLNGSVDGAAGVSGSAGKGSPGVSGPGEQSIVAFDPGGNATGVPSQVQTDSNVAPGKTLSVTQASDYSGQPMLGGSVDEGAVVTKNAGQGGSGADLLGEGAVVPSGSGAGVTGQASALPMSPGVGSGRTPSVSWAGSFSGQPMLGGSVDDGVKAPGSAGKGTPGAGLTDGAVNEGSVTTRTDFVRSPSVSWAGSFSGQPMLGGSVDDGVKATGSAGQGTPGIDGLMPSNMNAEGQSAGTMKTFRDGSQEEITGERDGGGAGVASASSLPDQPGVATAIAMTSLQDVLAAIGNVQQAVAGQVIAAQPGMASSTDGPASPAAATGVAAPAKPDANDDAPAATGAFSDAPAPQVDAMLVANAVPPPLPDGQAGPSNGKGPAVSDGTRTLKAAAGGVHGTDSVQQSAADTAVPVAVDPVLPGSSLTAPVGVTSNQATVVMASNDMPAPAASAVSGKGTAGKQGNTGKDGIRVESKDKHANLDSGTPAVNPSNLFEGVAKNTDVLAATGQKGSGNENSVEGKTILQEAVRDNSTAALGIGTAASASLPQAMSAHAPETSSPGSATQPASTATVATPSVDPTSGTALSGASLTRSIHQSEMKIGMNSEEFGSISIQTSLTHQAVSTQISVEHAALSTALMAHIPSMQERLGSSYGLQARVEVSQGSGGSAGGATGGSSEGRPQQSGSARGGYGGATGAGLASQPVASYVAGTSRLDVHF